MPLNRIKISIKNSQDAIDFVNELQKSGYNDALFLEDKNGECHVSAYSRLAVIYAVTTFPEIYLINESNEGFFPACIKERLIRE